MHSLPPPQDFLKFELSQYVDQPHVDWNIASVANLPAWVSAYPNIPSLLNLANQPSPSYTETDLEIRAEQIRFSDSNSNANLDAAIESEFMLLCQRWKAETIAVSSVSDMVMHPAYQRIIALGKPALPLILTELRDNSGHWFHALTYIVGRDAAQTAHSVPEARNLWLEWGYANNYI